jgi:hypothetical protein
MVTVQRKDASKGLRDTMMQLERLSEELSDLRERVAAPVLLGISEDSKSGGIPLEVHLDSIRKGVSRITGFQREAIEQYVFL